MNLEMCPVRVDQNTYIAISLFSQTMELNSLQRKLSNSKYQMDALDGLRGMAALIVILSHTSNEGWYLLPHFDFSGIGKAGVYLFFLLSSFLLALPLFEKGTSFFSVATMIHYWQRRFFRIYP